MIDDPSTDSLLLVMEHVDGGSLEQPYDAVSKTWETLPESLVHRHFRELCKVAPTLYLLSGTRPLYQLKLREV